MSYVAGTSDDELLALLRSGVATTVSELAEATDVTDTAVRQRLNRLMSEGLVCRTAIRAGRGRPAHRYTLTKKALRQLGSNFNDLAIILWREIREIEDHSIRRGLIARVASALAKMYRSRVQGETTEERMRSLAALFAERRVAFDVRTEDDTVVLQANQCPYPELAEEDRAICAVEKILFSELLSEDVRLSQCRLDGHTCCEFSTKPSGEALGAIETQ